MIGLELSWVRCLDGAEVIDLGPRPQPLPQPEGKAVVLSEEADFGVRIRHRSDEIRHYELRMEDLKQSMLERYLRCQDAEDFAAFVTDYGLPGPAEGIEGGRNAQEQSLDSLVNVRDGLKSLITSTDGVIKFNGISMALRPNLLPLFTTWKGGSPRLVFEPRNPNGFMLMEAAIALSNATALQTCLHCSRPFLAGPLTSKRIGAYYCSNRCRVAAQRVVTKRREEREKR
jgi:hypothetical protein